MHNFRVTFKLMEYFYLEKQAEIFTDSFLQNSSRSVTLNVICHYYIVGLDTNYLLCLDLYLDIACLTLNIL